MRARLLAWTCAALVMACRSGPALAGPEASAAALAGAAVLVLGATDEDREWSARISGHGGEDSTRIARVGRRLGEVPLNLGLLSAVGFYGEGAGDAQARQAFRAGVVSTFVTTGLIVPSIKRLAGRLRPNAGGDGDEFRPLAGPASFPSGHTALAFTLAGTISGAYPALTLPSVLAASSTAYSRVYTRAHWPSDVLAGAAIGFGVARGIAGSVDRFIPAGVEITPAAIGADAVGVVVRTRL